ncbi:hypothetical protein OXYTRIMIC_215 [Oxytricha trifallax]|uniref:Uncharacterized protein n=1 Tax=Oxytricha trifallax TaxID=1172189 RepID=A0A073HYM6_9SPIT|nr:hypothetical protein OXYTRIMIC_215 [Oxytricha trifallax]
MTRKQEKKIQISLDLWKQDFKDQFVKSTETLLRHNLPETEEYQHQTVANFK